MILLIQANIIMLIYCDTSTKFVVDVHPGLQANIQNGRPFPG